MIRYLVNLLLLISACAQPLPKLPPSDDRPSQIQILSLLHAETETPLDPAAIYVGTPLQVTMELRTPKGPATGSGLSVSIQQQGFLERFRFPEGDACTTDEQGRCRVLLVSTGIAGTLDLVARSTLRPDLVAQQDLTLIPDDRQLSMRFDLGAAGRVEWTEGQADPLANAPPFSVIANGGPAPLKIQVLGQQGNPISGLEILITAPPITEGESVKVQLHDSSEGRCGEALEARSQIITTGGEEGWAFVCLAGGSHTGRWSLRIALPDRIDAEHIPGSADGHFMVQGSTRSADPASIRALDASVDEPEPTRRCEPGLISAPIGFEVLDGDALAVTGIAVIARSEQLTLVGSPIHITDAEGRIQVLVQCPVSLPTPAALQVSLVDQPGLQTRVWVALWAQPVHQLIPRAGEVGAELGRAEPGQPFSVIIEARDRQASLVPDTRIDLQLLRWSGASELRLASEGDCNPEAPRLPEFMLTDGRTEVEGAPNPNYGILRLDLCAYGPATVARPMSLVAKVHGQELRREIPLLLEPGPPATVSFEPAEGIAMLLGGTFGPLAVTVRDGAGNGVAGAAVNLNAPDSLVVSASSGFTDEMGYFRFLITQAEAAGAVDLRAQAQRDDFQQETLLTVTVGNGTPQRMRLLRAGRAILEQAGATTLHIPIGQNLEEPILLRLENEVGGGMAGLGLSVSPLGDNPQGCGQIGPGGLQTDDAGELILGGDQVVVAAGPAVTTSGEDHCQFDLQHGPLMKRLRIIQTAGPPSGGSLVAIEDDGPNEFLATQSPPEVFDETNSQGVQLTVTDALGNPSAGLRVWFTASNCWIDQRIRHLDEQGQGTWRIAGGRDYSRPCVLQAVTDGAWIQAPTLSMVLDGHPLPRINGLRRADPSNNAAGYQLVNSTFFKLESGDSITRFHLDLADGYAPIRPADFDGRTGNCFNQDVAEQGGDPFQGCTKAELWSVDLDQEGEAQRSKQMDLPIEAAVEEGRLKYFLSLHHSGLGDGRELEIRFVEPDGAVGAGIPLYAHPPIEWLELTPDYLPIPLLPGADGEALKILGGQRHQLDDDPFLETVLCGLDDLGGWVQVLDMEGENYRFHGHRSWTHGVNPVSPYTPQIGRLACPLADLDDDGHLDLAQPTGVHQDNLLPRVAFLPGTGASPFFGEPVEAVLTAGQLNKPLIQLDFTGPPFTLWFGDSNVHGQAGDCSRRDSTRCGRVDLQHSPFDGNPNTIFGQASLADQGRQFNRAAFDTARVPGIGGITTSSYSGNNGHGFVTGVYPFAAAAKRPFRVPAEASGAIQLWTISEDGLTLALLLGDNTVRFIDRLSRKLLRTVQRPDAAYGRRFFTTDQQTIVSSNDEEVMLWDLNSGEVLARIPGFHPAIDAEGRWLVVQTGNDRVPTIRLYDLQAADAPVASWASQLDLPTLALQSGGERIAVAGCSNGSNCRVFLFDRELTLLHQWPAGCSWRGVHGGHLEFTPTGDELFCVTPDDGYLYNLDGELLWHQNDRGRPVAAGISPQSNHVLWHRDWGTCELGRLRDGFIIQSMAYMMNCRSPYFSADGRWAASDQSVNTLGQGIDLRRHLTWGEGFLQPVLQRNDAHHNGGGWEAVVTEKLLGQGSAEDGVVVYYRQQDVRVRELRTWRPHCGNGRLDPGETTDEGQPWEGTGRDIHCGAE